MFDSGKVNQLYPYIWRTTLRRTLGNSYLGLLQYFLNHRCFMRSELPEREGKSLKELLTGEPHPHWLELLGFKRFQRA